MRMVIVSRYSFKIKGEWVSLSQHVMDNAISILLGKAYPVWHTNGRQTVPDIFTKLTTIRYVYKNGCCTLGQAKAIVEELETIHGYNHRFDLHTRKFYIY